MLGVLKDGSGTLRIGKNVAEMERRVAELSGKAGGVMCNSGSSALYLAVELLDLPAGSEVITSPLTFSTDLAPLIRAGLVPVFVDIEPDTFNVDAAAIEEMIGPDSRAILLPNLARNAPDWDRVRDLADRHGIAVIEDSCGRADGARVVRRRRRVRLRQHRSLPRGAHVHVVRQGCAWSRAHQRISALPRDQAC